MSSDAPERVWVIKDDVAYRGVLDRLVLEPIWDYDDDGQPVRTVEDKLIITATVSDGSVSDAQRLAVSVLQGSKDAALALADEVLASFHSKGKYVSREALTEQRDHWLSKYSQVLDLAEGYRQALSAYQNVESIKSLFDEKAKYE